MIGTGPKRKQRRDLRRGRGLIAFMAEAEALQMMNLGNPDEEKASRSKYELAVEAARRPLANFRTYVTDVGSEFNTYLTQVSSSPVFQQAFQGSNWQFKIAEIDNLACYQRSVDLDYVGELQQGLSSTADSLSLLKLCLPTSFPIKAAISAEPQSSAITITSSSPNVSVAGLSFGQPSQEAPPSVVFTLGVNANYVQVVKYQDRCIVKNGHHRLYALTGGDRPGFFTRDIVMSQRPPSMRDFFDDDISANIMIQPTLNVIRIRAEQFPMPVPAEAVQPGGLSA